MFSFLLLYTTSFCLIAVHLFILETASPRSSSLHWPHISSPDLISVLSGASDNNQSSAPSSPRSSDGSVSSRGQQNTNLNQSAAELSTPQVRDDSTSVQCVYSDRVCRVLKLRELSRAGVIWAAAWPPHPLGPWPRPPAPVPLRPGPGWTPPQPLLPSNTPPRRRQTGADTWILNDGNNHVFIPGRGRWGSSRKLTRRRWRGKRGRGRRLSRSGGRRRRRRKPSSRSQSSPHCYKYLWRELNCRPAAPCCHSRPCPARRLYPPPRTPPPLPPSRPARPRPQPRPLPYPSRHNPRVQVFIVRRWSQDHIVMTTRFKFLQPLVKQRRPSRTGTDWGNENRRGEGEKHRYEAHIIT